MLDNKVDLNDNNNIDMWYCGVINFWIFFLFLFWGELYVLNFELNDILF